MKKIYFSLTVLAAVILLSATLTQKGNFSVFNSTTSVNPDDPVLPDTPFDYDIDFPDHVLNSIWGPPIDPTSINAAITPEVATLGRVLFYDKKLSASNEVACASCHKQEFGFADDVAFSEGIDGTLTERNSPNINDLSWNSSIFFGFETNFLFWDARESNLDEMVLQPITHEGELGKDLEYLLEKLALTEYYPPLFQEAFGDPAITADRIGIAMGQFVRSMSSFDTKFDRVMAGDEEFTSAEEAGFQVFQQSCDFVCHSQPHFGSSMPMNNGLEEEYEDEGVAAWSGNEFEIGKFKSPSLRNIAVTAPYMHDGRFETLEEVVDFYSDDVFPHPNNDFGWSVGDPANFTGFDFTQTQKDNLVTFLHTLTDDTYLTHEKWANPFKEVSSTSFTPLEEKVEIYPNPISSSAVISLENTNGAQYNMRLTSLQGRVLRTFKTTSSTIILEKDDLPAGVYLLEIMKEDRKKVEQVVLK